MQENVCHSNIKLYFSRNVLNRYSIDQFWMHNQPKYFQEPTFSLSLWFHDNKQAITSKEKEEFLLILK
jgi:hypothetical protein